MRLLGFLFHNWPLKLAALVLATLLYGGLIVTASADTFRAPIAIQILNEPAQVQMMNTLDDVTSVQYIALGASHPIISQASFSAYIDLAGVTVQPGSAPISVPVIVKATNPDQVQVVDYFPSRVQVFLEPLTSKDVPVRVNLGTVPDGVDVVSESFLPQTVTATGPNSVTSRVANAEARVRIQPSGVSLNQAVDLVPVDALGNVLTEVRLSPSSVHVSIQVASQRSTKAVPVNPVVSGSPAAGYALSSVSAVPVLVTVAGSADVLASLAKVDTAPVKIDGATSAVTADVGLVLPADVTLVGGGSVKVTAQVQAQQGSRDFSVGLVLANTGTNLGYDVATDHVVATIGGPIALLNALNGSTLAATLDVGGLSPGTHVVAATIRLPASLSLVGVAPTEVAVTVTAAPSPSPLPSPSPSPSPTPSPSPSL